MKKLFLFMVSSVFIMASCYEEIVYTENPFLVRKKELDFKELKALDPVITLGGTARIQAMATGDSLVFLWSAEQGSIVANDSLANFTFDQEGHFMVVCTVTDKYGNSLAREISIQVSPELVFTSLVSEEDKVPTGYNTLISATASGDELTYEWLADGGVIQGNGPQVSFMAETAGTYIISCTVTDLVGQSYTQEVEISVVDGFVFKDLIAEPNRLPAHDNSYLSAITLGNNLNYRWTCDPPAVLLGTGDQIIFNICHADIFTVTCEVTDDKGNYKAKSVVITVTNL